MNPSFISMLEKKDAEYISVFFKTNYIKKYSIKYAIMQPE
jgi:hypothetical protein